MNSGRFQKGKKKSGGRRKGTPNAKTVEARQLATRVLDDPLYLECLARRINAGKAVEIEKLLWQYKFGKPPDKLELTGPDGGPLGVAITDANQLIDKFASRLARLAPATAHPQGAPAVQPA